ncbi:HxHSH motif-containing lipoprotein [Metamycoplasma phocicerebrale]|nr:hypothetical protein [Metamycoplasma phocicerebrale]
MNWKNKMFLKYASTLSIVLVPFFSISCIKYPNDKENINLDGSIDNKDETKDFIFNHEIPKKIKEIYGNSISELFLEVKEKYRNYRTKYFNINRKLKSLSKKVEALIPEQGIPENSAEIEKFYNKWLLEDGKDRCKLAKLFNKYQLIFQDVDAVLSDVNLVFDNQQFLKFIKVLDQRESGIDIKQGEIQNAIISSWKFLKNHLYNKAKISKEEDLEKINIESDKNSHSHSHAIINLMFEMGLWHLLLKKNVLDINQLNEFKKDYATFKKNVVDNIGQRNYESDYKFLIDLFENEMELEDNNNLMNKIFQTKAEKIMNQLKALLNEQIKKEGLENDIFLGWND